MAVTIIPPVTNDNITIKDLKDAIALYRNDAAKVFVEAHNGLPPKGAVPATDTVPAKPAETAEETKKRSQGQLAAAFSQLSSAETMRSAQQGRDGYKAVVKLMKSTQATASSICTQLTELVKPTDPAKMLTATEVQARLPIITALTDILQVLAQITPTSVWEPPSASGGAAS